MILLRPGICSYVSVLPSENPEDLKKAVVLATLKYQLTVPQREVVFFSIQGYAKEEIAEELGISSRAVTRTLDRVFLKTKARNPVHLCWLMVGGWDPRAARRRQR